MFKTQLKKTAPTVFLKKMIFYEEIIAHPKNINEYSIESFFPTFFAI